MAEEESDQPQGIDEKLVIDPGGSKTWFPRDTTPQEVQDYYKGRGLNILPNAPVRSQYNFDPALTNTINAIRPFVAGAAGHAAGLGGTALGGPVVGAAADVGAYTGMDYLLKQLRPDNKDLPDNNIMDSAKDGTLNMVTGKILNGIWKTGQAFRNAGVPEITNFAPTSSQVLESYGYHKLATAAKFAEDFGATGAKAEALDRAGGKGFAQALGYANSLNGRMYTTNQNPVKLANKIRETLEQGLTPGQSANVAQALGNKTHVASDEALQILDGGANPFAKIDEVLQDSNRLQKVLTAGQLQGQAGANVRKDLQAYQFMRMINDSTSKDLAGKVRIDPKKLGNMWNDADMQDSFDLLYGKKGREDVSAFLKNIYNVQQPMQTYPVAKGVRAMGAGFQLGLDLVKGDFSALAQHGKVASALYIPAAAMGRLLTKEGVANALAKLAEGSQTAKGNPILSRMLVSGLEGTNLAINGPNGEQTWGTFKKNKDTGSYEFVEYK